MINYQSNNSKIPFSFNQWNLASFWDIFSQLLSYWLGFKYRTASRGDWDRRILYISYLCSWDISTSCSYRFSSGRIASLYFWQTIAHLCIDCFIGKQECFLPMQIIEGYLLAITRLCDRRNKKFQASANKKYYKNLYLQNWLEHFFSRLSRDQRIVTLRIHMTPFLNFFAFAHVLALEVFIL